MNDATSLMSTEQTLKPPPGRDAGVLCVLALCSRSWIGWMGDAILTMYILHVLRSRISRHGVTVDILAFHA